MTGSSSNGATGTALVAMEGQEAGLSKKVSLPTGASSTKVRELKP